MKSNLYNRLITFPLQVGCSRCQGVVQATLAIVYTVNWLSWEKLLHTCETRVVCVCVCLEGKFEYRVKSCFIQAIQAT